MKKSTALKFVCQSLTVLIGFSAMSAHATDGIGDKAAPLKGCYHVTKGTMSESAVTAQTIIGSYKFVLTPSSTNKGHSEVITLKGPLSGAEGGSDGGAESAGEIHGGHVMGTDDRVGTLSTADDSIQIASASCPAADGTPRLIKGIESINFSKGTGIFSGVISGHIDFDLNFDGCTKPNNPIADLVVRQGDICFQ